MNNATIMQPPGDKQHGGKITVKVKHFEENGERLIRVPLFGVSGEGKSMVLDSEVWREGRLNGGWPAVWIVIPEPKSGRAYVATCRRPISDDRAPVSLSRLIMAAQPGEIITFKDRDSLNLRQSNLVRMTQREAYLRRFGLTDDIEEIEESPEADLGPPW